MSCIETIQLEWFSVDEKLPELTQSDCLQLEKYSKNIWFKTISNTVFIGHYTDMKLFYSDGWFSYSDVVEWCYPPIDIN